MATANLNPSADGIVGLLDWSNPNDSHWPPVGSASADTGSDYLRAQSTRVFNSHTVYETFLLGFDTSGLAGTTITAATLTLYCTAAANANSGSSLLLEAYDYGASIDAADYAIGALGTALDSKTQDLVTPGSVVFTISSPDSVINKTGTTKFRLALSAAPISFSTNSFTFSSNEHATSGQRPVLSITYTEPPVDKDNAVAGAIAGSIGHTVDGLTASSVSGAIAGSVDQVVEALTDHQIAAGMQGSPISLVAALSEHALASAMSGAPTSAVIVPRPGSVAAGIAGSIGHVVGKTTTVVMPIDRITDHVAQALDRLAGQFR